MSKKVNQNQFNGYNNSILVEKNELLKIFYKFA